VDKTEADLTEEATTDVLSTERVRLEDIGLTGSPRIRRLL